MRDELHHLAHILTVSRSKDVQTNLQIWMIYRVQYLDNVEPIYHTLLDPQAQLPLQQFGCRKWGLEYYLLNEQIFLYPDVQHETP